MMSQIRTELAWDTAGRVEEVGIVDLLRSHENVIQT